MESINRSGGRREALPPKQPLDCLPPTKTALFKAYVSCSGPVPNRNRVGTVDLSVDSKIRAVQKDRVFGTVSKANQHALVSARPPTVAKNVSAIGWPAKRLAQRGMRLFFGLGVA